MVSSILGVYQIMRCIPFLLIIASAQAGPGPTPKSAFDLTTDFPIPGSKGRIVADGPNLRFEQDPPGSRRVLVGTNLTGMACFPQTDDMAATWADDLRRRGYNAIRFHHIDWVIRDRGWSFKANADRFIAALKRRGIYVTIDLFSERASDVGAFKRGVLNGDRSIRDDWSRFAERLLTEPSQAKGCLAWNDEPTIFGLCPLNEDDPRFLKVQPNKYDSAYRWMLKRVRDIGYDGLVWGLNSGIDAQFAKTGAIFNVEDFHIYWDHPQGDQYLNTSGVRQYWQFPARQFPKRPWISTEWGSLAFNRLRGETGLFFAGQMENGGASCVLSFALATNEAMMAGKDGPLDQMALYTDPVRLATERVMVLLMRRPSAPSQVNWNKQWGSYSYTSPKYKLEISGDEPNRRADFLGSLDAKPLQESTRMLLIRFGDAQNTGFRSHVIRDKVVFKIDDRGTKPVRERALSNPFEFTTGRAPRAWSLDPYTGQRKKELDCRQLKPGTWQIKTISLNTEIVTSTN